MKNTIYFIIILLFISFEINSQTPKKPSSSKIYQSIQKLNFLGSVLYLAAHPDDENTRLISYFSNQVHARTAYLSLTRGDGGQNLIGPEIREQLGVIRTNELLQARLIDGGIQFFTRANDFGYSKNPEETLQIWNEEEVLKDMVKVIREFQPDIIINRFNVESAGKTHGHHTSSAILSTKAFDLAADKDYLIQNTSLWQTKRLFFNTSWWFYGSRENFEKNADKSKMIELNTGVYYPIGGLSNTEIASLSRSMHKSQGFGNTGTRGTQNEYIEFLKGSKPESNELFDGIDTTWNRIDGGKQIGDILEDVEDNFDFKNPSASLPNLMKAYQLIQKLDNKHWRIIKSQEIKKIISACSGLYIEAVSDEQIVTGGETVEVNIEAINRSNAKIFLKKIIFSAINHPISIEKRLENNNSLKFKQKIIIPKNESQSNPYWLNENGTLGMYVVQNESFIGKPLTPRKNKAIFNLVIEGTPINLEREIVYKYNDPVGGEVYQPFEIIPEITLRIASKVIIFDDEIPKEIPIKINAYRSNIKGNLKLDVPKNWKVSPKFIPVEFLSKNDTKSIVFTVTPSKDQSEGFVKPIFESGGRSYNKSLVEINYDHIPKQTLLIPAEVKVVRLNITKKGKQVAYIKGAGDEIPISLQQIGYQVTEIDPREISELEIKKYDAVIVGIRAYNINEDLINKQAILLDYVKGGGNLIVQYNTAHRLKVTENLAPYSLKLSRDRVTEENAKVTILAPNHELMNYPNKINNKDFEGWVQERGLYFPNEWADEFTPLFSMHDKGEDPKNGSLLIAKYGKGHYIYTGLSFFRELPAGVPGAYKLFANMISVGKNDLENELKN
ncbi:MAG: PIG-L family deacetylase [Bacteroidota bacterium]